MVTSMEPTSVYPMSLSNLTHKDIEELRTMKWTDEEIKLSGLSNLPTHLQSKVYIISTHGNRNFIEQKGVVIPGNSIIRLYNPEGVIEMGWKRLVKPTGHFVDNGEVFGPANAKFTHSDFNKFCMLVRTPNLIFKNTSIPNCGASVDAYWNVAANDGGPCQVAFNDEDNNNTGTFTQYLEVWQASVFADWIANLAK